MIDCNVDRKENGVPCPWLGVGMECWSKHGHSEQWPWHTNIARRRLFLSVRLVFHAKFKSAASVGNAEDRAADFLLFAGTGTFLFQIDKDRLRFGRVELQDD